MSPILVRPVREQLEHDRVIRLLQAKYKRKFDVAINPGNEQTAPVSTGTAQWYPDLVLHSTERKGKLAGVVEVETVESINHLEAMSQWAAFARLKAPFHLYVPAGMVDVARRFCTDLQIAVTEVWAYHAIGDQIRFTAIVRAPGSDDGMSTSREARRPVAKPAASAAKPRPVAKVPARPPAKAAGKAVAAKPVATKTAAPKVTAPKVAPAKSKAVAGKGAKRPALPAPKKVTKPAKAAKPAARAVVKKAAPRAAKRK